MLLPVAADILTNNTGTLQGHLIILPQHVKHKSLTTLPGLYKLINGKTNIIMFNVTPNSITIKPGTILANAEYTDIPIQTDDLPQTRPSYHSSPSNHEQETSIQNAMKEATENGKLENHTYRIALESLFRKHPGILPTPSRPIGRTNLLQHHIQLTPDATPVRIPTYRVPHSKRVKLEEEVQGMLNQGIIEDSDSPWSSPLLLVPKKDGSWRPVVDYRQLNKLTVSQPYPVPMIKELLMDINRNSTIFSSIDLKSGFLQLPLHPDSRQYTAFSTQSGHYHFLVTPMGLTNSPLSFVRLMNSVLQGLIPNDVMVYIDDILVSSKDLPDHIKQLDKVFNRLNNAGLTINVTKCKFLAPSLTFLGHTIDKRGISPNNLKITAIQYMPPPKSTKEIKSFLGVCGFYRDHVPYYSQLQSPLTALLKKDVPFTWESKHQTSFESLKKALTTAPILIFPDYRLPFHLYTDASATGLGAVLLQDIQNQLKPVAYASRMLLKAERNYCTTDRELLAIVWALKHFRELILGYEIHIWTDHNPLTPLLSPNAKDVHGRKARYQMTLNEYNATINFVKGTNNIQPDMLSRMLTQGAKMKALDLSGTFENFPPSFAPVNATRANVPLTKVRTKALDEEEIKTELLKCPKYSKIIEALSSGNSLPKVPGIALRELSLHNGLLYRTSPQKRIKGHLTTAITTLVIPDSLIPRILWWAHEGNLHVGYTKALVATRNKYYFPKMASLMAKHVYACQSCPLHKGSTGPPIPGGTYPPANYPWQYVFTDILALPTSTTGQKLVITFIDKFSRYVEIVPLTDKSADSVALAFYSSIICRWGTPEGLISDNAQEYIGNVLQSLSNLLNIERPKILPYRPQANSISERLNRTILNLVRSLTDQQKANWCKYLPSIQSCINGAIHKATGDSPDFILMGRDRRMPYELIRNPKIQPFYTGSTSENILRDLQRSHMAVKQALDETYDKALSNKENILRTKFINPADIVYKLIHVSGNIRNKLSNKFTGPLRVTKTKKGKALCRCIDTGKEEWVHLDDLKLDYKNKE